MWGRIKRKLLIPYYDFKRKRILYNNIMSPEEIQIQEKKFHDMYIEANRKGNKQSEIEYIHKRDAIRLILKKDVVTK